jgi:hypothetical protein
MIGSLAAVMETAGAARTIQTARTLVNFVHGFELERLIKPQLTTLEFERRLTPLLENLCRVLTS